MPSLNRPDVKLHYETMGDGPPLLLLAGIASDNASWAPVIEPLSDTHTLVMPDNRGCGRTTPLDAPCTVPLMAADCLALIDELNIEALPVLGHSMGGIIAMEMVRQEPATVSELVLAASSPQAAARTMEQLDVLIALGEADCPEELWFRNLFLWPFNKSFFDNPLAVETAVQMAIAYPYKQPVNAMRLQFEALQQLNISGVRTDIACPTLAIIGQEDLMFPPKELRTSLAAFSNIEIVELENATHSVHWDDPHGFVLAVSKFFSK